MLMRTPIIPLALILLLIQLPDPAVAKDLADTLVSVVGLDEQGQPKCQGMGVVVGESGAILTSASLLFQGGGGIVRTNSGAMYSIQQLTHCDLFQDLAQVKIEAEGLPTAKLAPPGNPWPGGKVTTGRRQGNRCLLREARVARSHPFSPRLIILKLEPNTPGLEPGTPIFNQRDELVGMLHAFGQGPQSPNQVRLWLVRDQASIPKGGTVAKELVQDRWAQIESGGYAPFWEGVAASQRQDWQTAKDKFTTMLRSKGNLPEAYFGRGLTRYWLGDFAGAVEDLMEATKQLPGYALAFLWLGRGWQRQGNQKSAQEAYQRALLAVPGLSEAWFRLGVIYYQEGALSQAQDCFEKAQDDFPEAAQCWWYRGMVARDQQRFDLALEAFNHAVKLEPGFFPAYLEGGKLLIQDLGRAKEAVDLLKEAVRLKPRHADARYYLAMAQLLSWNPAGAWEQYFTLQELQPDLAAGLAAALEGNR